MAVARKRAGDLTGIETQRLQKENQDELKRKAKEMSMMVELEAEQSEIPIDYSNGPISSVPKDDLDVEEEIELENPTRVIIPNTTLESMTFGQGQHYTFEEGVKYTVSLDIARHLQTKGLLYTGSYR